MVYAMVQPWVIAGVAVLYAAPSLQTFLPRRYTNHSDPFGPLTFSEDGTFQISILEDLHFGESTVPFPPQQ